MDFIAIDLETANADMASICQIGLAWYQDGNLLKEWVSYVDPQDHFEPANISIHGIDQDTTTSAPAFPELAQVLFEYLDQRIVVSHTHFDRLALLQAFDKHEISPPEFAWLDTSRVVRHTWEQFSQSGYGLVNVCEFLGYKYEAHNALQDAKAAGHVLLAAIEHADTDLLTLANDLGQSSSSKSNKANRNRSIHVVLSIDEDGNIIEEEVTDNNTDKDTGKRKQRYFSQRIEKRIGNPNGPLYGERLVFTGSLSIARDKAADMAAAAGCQIDQGVTKKTTILVVGDQDISLLSGHEKSSKHRKAEKYIAKGLPIRILRESDFKRLIELDEESPVREGY